MILGVLSQVAACKGIFPEKEKDCGSHSEAVRGKTLNGMPGVISDLLVTCKQNLPTNTVLIQWKPPLTSNGVIDRYKIEVKWSASYINEEGQRQFENKEHRPQNVGGSARNFTFQGALPNTNYTVKVCGLNSILYTSYLSDDFILCLHPSKHHM